LAAVGYRRVLVGTDGSETASMAVQHAADLAVTTGTELIVVTAYTPDPLHERELADAREQAPADLQWMITDAGEADERLTSARRLAADAGVAKVRTVVQQGDPADVLISTAEELSCDVIVVGNVGMAGASRFLLGSVPNKVSHHAPCDVLIVSTTG
jgi:nucleotide-binding universal stress UspA family protein